MGLLGSFVLFRAPPRPTEEAFRSELARQIGTASGLVDFEYQGDVLVITAEREPVTIAYAEKILLDWGGEKIHHPGDLTPKASQAPAFVQRPWKEWPWWERARIRLGRRDVGGARGGG
jgi:hypothetical protein